MTDLTYENVLELMEVAPDIVWMEGRFLYMMTPDENAEFHPKGVFRNGIWGFCTEHEINEDGTFTVMSY